MIVQVGVEREFLNKNQNQIQGGNQIQKNDDLFCLFPVFIQEKCDEAPDKQERKSNQFVMII